jgi:hypothetical protein
MSVDSGRLRTVLAGPAVLASFALLVGPLVAGAVDTRLMTPLALPGYFLLTVGGIVGNWLFPAYRIWVYWGPFLLASYAIAVVVGVGYRAVRKGGKGARGQERGRKREGEARRGRE